MFRSDSGRTPRWVTTAALLVFVLGLVAAPAASAANRHYTAGASSADPYQDEVLGAGTAEGDVWGGEQGTTPDGDEALEPSRTGSIADDDLAEAVRWFRIASLFAWLRASLWFSDQE